MKLSSLYLFSSLHVDAGGHFSCFIRHLRRSPYTLKKKVVLLATFGW